MTRIGLLSDTHAYWDEKYLEYFESCDEIWHAGDIGSVEVAEKLAAFRPLRAVYGKDRTIIHPGDKLLSRLMDLIQTFYFQYAHSIRVYSLYGLQSS